MAANQISLPELVSTGIPGLDQVLGGGLPRHHLYLVYGEAGAGKTTMGLQFIMDGVRAEETALLVTLGETRSDLEEIALSHGWSLDGVEIYELRPVQAAQQMDDQQTIFPTSEVELTEVTDEIVSLLRRTKPQRVVFDSMTELRLLANNPLRHRRQILALSEVLDEIEATVLFTERQAQQWSDRVLDSLVHGIIHLERYVPKYGTARRRLDVSKLRGMSYQEGWHDFRIVTGGIEVYPVPRIGAEHREYADWKQLSSGLPELDRLVGGGLEMGTSCLIAGASGTGKSSISGLYAYHALQQGVPSAIFIFDERPETLYKRSEDLGAPLRPYVEDGLLVTHQVATGTISPGKFAHDVYDLVVNQGVRLVIVDSLTGYLRAMQEENQLQNQMHDLLSFLSHHGVLSILIVTHHGLLGQERDPALDMSYLSDTVLLLRHFEAGGTVRQAISVLKKRHGGHEKTIREVRIRAGGIEVGKPLVKFRGVLSGNPVYEGASQVLLDVTEPEREST